MSKSIVLDLDGVVCDIVGGLNRELEKIGIPDFDYSGWLLTGIDDEVSVDIFNNNLFWKNLKPFEDAWHQVNYWFNSGVDVHIVTSRRTGASVSNTASWLDMWKINTMSPKFSEVNKKHEIISEIDPLFVVEDNPLEVEILIEKGIKCYLRRTWYNKEYWDVLPTIGNLYEIRDF